MVRPAYIAFCTGCVLLALCWVHIALLETNVIKDSSALHDSNLFVWWFFVLSIASWPQVWLAAHFYYCVSKRMAIMAGVVWLAMVGTAVVIVLALSAVT